MACGSESTLNGEMLLGYITACWKVWTLPSSVFHLNKIHHLTTCEEWGHKTGSHESTRLINKQLSDLWKVPTPEENSISGPFVPEELAAPLRRLKPGKSPGRDYIFLDFILHVGLPLNLVLRFPQFLHAPTQKHQDLEKNINSCNPWAEKPIGDAKNC